MFIFSGRNDRKGIIPKQGSELSGINIRNKERGYWELPYREAVSLGLDNRIMND